MEDFKKLLHKQPNTVLGKGAIVKMLETKISDFDNLKKSIDSLIEFNIMIQKENDEALVSELINCEIIHKNGTFLGKVISVDNFGAGDLLETIYKGKKIYIPLNNDNVVSVDLEKKIIFVNPIKGIVDND